MTPREQLIQEILQAPESLIDVLLKLLRSPQSNAAQIVHELNQLAYDANNFESVGTASALDLASDLAGCLTDGPVDLSSNPDYMQGFGT